MENLQFSFDLTPAERDAYEVCKWIKANKSDFRKLMRVFHLQVNEGNPCTKQGEIEAYARETGIRFDNGGEFVHNRNLYPGLCRYAVMLMPRLARTINFRKSRLDEIDLAAIWHEVVNSGTTFLADNRYLAQHYVDIDDARAR